VGRPDQWIKVRTHENRDGYIYATYLALHDAPVAYVRVKSAAGVNLRASRDAEADVLWHVPDGTVLDVEEDGHAVLEKLGKERWIAVSSPSLHRGFVSGLYVRAVREEDQRVKVEDQTLPYGDCAWIFGIHAAGATTPADFRPLFAGKGKTGWVLFTEAVGANPFHGGGHDYTPWSHAGFGVIVRLNHGYEPDGTLPLRGAYADFARACASYVRESQGCHVWIIGNEQNNPREHPGGAEAPVQHITPGLYAEAFNLARQLIKEEQAEAVVVPGAIDPYNTFPYALLGGRRYRPLDYFKEMLAEIVDVDGIALHTYTHWMDRGLVRASTVFEDPFLEPGTPHEHYYDFQAYRPFAEAIPKRWREKPIFITETNHLLALDHEPRGPEEGQRLGWLNRNSGWVRTAYEEIERWNGEAHAQQIRCLLLYRWIGDDWAIHDKGAVLDDFDLALENDYRWRT
jgi:hypothetical protein